MNDDNLRCLAQSRAALAVAALTYLNEIEVTLSNFKNIHPDYRLMAIDCLAEEIRKTVLALLLQHSATVVRPSSP